MNTHSVGTNVPASSAPKFTLVQSLTAILTRAGHPCPQSWIPSLDNEVARAEAMGDENYQRMLINRYWRRILGDAELAGVADTKTARFCLVDDCDTDRWLNLFETGVVPCIIKNNLSITPN
jgi:hypothetical protein